MEAVVMTRRVKTGEILLVAVVMTVLSAATAFALPDLVAWVGHRGVPVERGDQIVIPFSVTVQNRGTEPAPPFKISVEYEVVSGGMATLRSGAVPFTVSGQSDPWHPRTTSPLPNGPPPASTVTFTGEVILTSTLSGAEIRIRALADSTAGEEFADPVGRVRESDETNNHTPWVDLRPTTGSPDLVLRSQTRPAYFNIEGRNIVEDRSRGGGYSATIENRGNAPAGPFSIAVEYEVVQAGEPEVPTHGLVAIIPMEDRSVEGLMVGGTHTFNNLVLRFPDTLVGSRIKIRIRIDDANAVNETDEFNNEGPWSPLFFLPRRIESRTIPGTLLLRSLGAALRGSIHLNNFAGPTSDFQLDNEPFRENDSWIRVGSWEERFTPERFIYGSGATESRYYLNDINGDFGGPGAMYFWGEKIAMKTVFETGGDHEIRGWEYTWPNWYDSPPDVDLTRIELVVALRPIIRDGRLSYDRVTVAPTIELTLHGFWEFIDEAFLSRGIQDPLRNMMHTEIRNKFEALLMSEEIRRLAEDEMERIIAPSRVSMRIKKLTSVRVTGDALTISYEVEP
jgi:hypothetical protein